MKQCSEERLPKAPSAEWFHTFRVLLRRWYSNHKRDLPWRGTSDPYAIWVSEIMLQQTQVATVIDYYHRFLQEFPTVASLAVADEQRVLELWSGLGYYRRARQLHLAAKKIVAEHGGKFPRESASIQELPGIGRYTAGAVASFAFDAKMPILEANTIRLFSRLIALRECTTTANATRELWKFAEDILPDKGGSGTINQAVMELGSRICTPANPACSRCPVAKLCPTFAQGLEKEIPVAKPKTEFTPLTHVAVIARRGSQVLLRRQPLGQWWEGLWDLPKFANATHHTRKTEPKPELVIEEMRRHFGLECSEIQYFKQFRHGVTRYRITLQCFLARVSRKPNSSDWCWAELADPPALTSPARKVISSLRER